MQTLLSVPEISVLMPTFNQSAFLLRALESLQGQEFKNWELIIINDGSTDETEKLINNYPSDARIIYQQNEANTGLGNALNQGLALARGKYIAYLPSDDLFYADHLQSLYRLLESKQDKKMAFSGLRYNYNRFCKGQINGHPLQLVQVMHRKSEKRWLQREELVTDDLSKMYWEHLCRSEEIIGSGNITCEWVSHPDQRHKKIQEPEGGINKYRSYYQVTHPLRFQSTVGNLVDEHLRFERFKVSSRQQLKGLTILLVGELAYNPERILALEERGHRLVGLWTKDPYWFNYVGPLPFGNIETLDASNWKDELKRIKPDIIYGLLNWQAVPFVHEILTENPGIPFVWNFKEGPFICLEKGTWGKLIDLYSKSDGQIFTSPEMQEWFTPFIPNFNPARAIVLDGDLPKKDWFEAKQSKLLSEKTGEVHTVVPGRPIGLHPEVVAELARERIHLHFYGDFNHGVWKEWIERTRKLVGEYLHIHPNVDQADWVAEFSQYDAGWLHTFESKNQGEIRRANWDDLNYPARMATLALAGVPFIQRDNSGHIVATQTLAREHQIGVFYRDIKHLGQLLHNERLMQKLRANVWRKREIFTFDHHVDRLVEFFKAVVEGKEGVPPNALSVLTSLQLSCK